MLCVLKLVFLWCDKTCVFSDLNYRFPADIPTFPFGFIRFRYTGFYRSYTVPEVSRSRFRPNQNLCERKWWEEFSDRSRPFTPLVLFI
jgi:hypothetical protein